MHSFNKVHFLERLNTLLQASWTYSRTLSSKVILKLILQSLRFNARGKHLSNKTNEATSINKPPKHSMFLVLQPSSDFSTQQATLKNPDRSKKPIMIIIIPKKILSSTYGSFIMDTYHQQEGSLCLENSVRREKSTLNHFLGQQTLKHSYWEIKHPFSQLINKKDPTWHEERLQSYLA